MLNSKLLYLTLTRNTFLTCQINYVVFLPCNFYLVYILIRMISIKLSCILLNKYESMFLTCQNNYFIIWICQLNYNVDMSSFVFICQNLHVSKYNVCLLIKIGYMYMYLLILCNLIYFCRKQLSRGVPGGSVWNA